MDKISIAVNGAGVAGLAAAGELLSAGLKVSIFESSIGGRVCTVKFGNDKPLFS